MSSAVQVGARGEAVSSAILAARPLTIGLEQAAPSTQLWALLESAIGVRFRNDVRNNDAVAGIIEISAAESFSGAIANGAPGLHVRVRQDERAEESLEEVTFADHARVPWPFRGRSLRTLIPSRLEPLSVSHDEIVLARCASGPIWTVCERGARARFRSGFGLPTVSPETGFADVFGGERFMALLPLMSFFQELRGANAHRYPPLRASFIIDDPNLHWPSYGYIDYADLARHAERENYHLAFATIPLDTWFTHARTARLFREHSDRLSLLVHGNNHARAELARDYTQSERRALVDQALRRVTKLEAKAGVPVSRVMVPPHGACSAAMLGALVEGGFESACISTGSVRAHNKEQSWTRSLGFLPGEIIEDCAVLPRWGLTGSIENAILVAAYLGKALILRGHHQDFREGPIMFDRYARLINGLGNVRWTNMTEISRTTYLWSMDGDVCRIAPIGQITRFRVPAEAKSISVESVGGSGACNWQIAAADGPPRVVNSGEVLSMKDFASDELELRRMRAPATEKIGRAATDPKLIVRRLLTEARDRLLSF